MKLLEIMKPGALSLLDGHRAIGWDFDRTLIDNPHAPLFYDYILSTPNKRHVIVTFRTHGMLDTLFDELEDRAHAPDSTAFDDVFSIGGAAWSAWAHDDLRRRQGALQGPPTEAEHYYVHWKGLACSQHGLSILIDDDVGNTAPGCAKYGIVLLNAISLGVVST